MYRELTGEQVRHFLERGYVVLEQVLSLKLAEEWRSFAFERLGYDPDDPATWAEERIHMPTMNRRRVAEVAPRAWAAICDLVGGEGRIKSAADYSYGDGFIINFGLGAGQAWQPPSPAVAGWHKDGDFFRHFLDSPEQGLLGIVIWSDIGPPSGGTLAAPDSVAPIARRLAEHPEGLLPAEAGLGELIHQCSDFEELTGRAGDVVLLHPYVLHSASCNPSGRPRFITNPNVTLAEPMNFKPRPRERLLSGRACRTARARRGTARLPPRRAARAGGAGAGGAAGADAGGGKAPGGHRLAPPGPSSPCVTPPGPPAPPCQAYAAST